MFHIKLTSTVIYKAKNVFEFAGISRPRDKHFWQLSDQNQNPLALPLLQL